MRIFYCILSACFTIALIIALNTRLAGVPPLGYFLSPQHGFWKNAEPTTQNFNAQLSFPQLKGSTSVYIDDRLVPHIFAENENDAYFVQGYLHAKFRLWQMEFQTFAAGGRLGEIFGEKIGDINVVEQVDKQFRRLGMVYAAENSLQKMETDSTTKKLCDAYTAGINAYISALQEKDLPLEYKLLDYKPELWTNLKSALFLKYMSFDLAGSENDFEYTNARAIFNWSKFELMYPITQDSLDPIVPKGTLFEKPSVHTHIPKETASISYFGKKDLAYTKPYKPDPDNGSNNWAVAGSKTKSGRPILCNDPHLNLNLPSLWFEMQIHTPYFNTYGATFPGVPSVIIGFNDSCAWGFTNAMRDVRDYYEIQFKDSTMRAYWYNNAWQKTTFRKEIIKVRGQKDMVENIAMTVFGPVMYDQHFPNPLHNGKYYAVRWKAHDASNEMLMFNKLNHAKNYNDYYTAIKDYECPGQNMLFATKKGDIALWQQGKFPAKWYRQGDFVMPGIDSSFMWQGYISQQENPHQINPARGFVSSANQLPTDTKYPYYLGGSYPLYRGLSINRNLSAMKNISIADMQALQTNNYDVFAAIARPVLLKYLNINELNTEEQACVSILTSWGLNDDVFEKGPIIFETWWDNLEEYVWQDELAQSKLPLLQPDESTLLEGIIKDSNYIFVDNIQTPQKETLRQQVTNSFKKAAATINKLYASGQNTWSAFKDAEISHLLNIPALSRLHLLVGGGRHAINCIKKTHGPSWRMVVELTDNIQAYGVYPGGQSGNPGSKYYDAFVDTWAASKYYALWLMHKGDEKDKRIQWAMRFSNPEDRR